MREVIIRINVRPAWHQRTMLAWGSDELEERMRQQGWLALRQVDGRWNVVVSAQCGGMYRELVVSSPRRS